jgi:hypothetical protein
MRGASAVSAFIRRQLIASHADGRLARLDVRLQGETGTERIELLEVADDGSTVDSKVEALALDIEQITESHANTVGGTQEYVILAYPEKAAKYSALLRTRVTGELVDGMGGGRTDSPTKAGELSQALRHNEVLMRIATAGTTAQIQQLLEHNRALSSDLADEREVSTKLRGLIRQLEDEKDRRAVLQKKEELKLEAAREALQLGKTIVPMLGAKVLQLPSLGAGGDTSKLKNLSLGNWLFSLSEEQRESLFKALLSIDLSEEQKMGLQALIMEALQTAEQQQQSKQGAA